MIDYEEMLYNVTMPTDALIKVDPETGDPYEPKGRQISFYDICLQYNLTIGDDEELGVDTIPPKVRAINMATNKL